MIKLVRNENMKLGRSLSTWIMMGILVLIIIAAGFILKYNTKDTEKTDWKADTKKQLEVDKKDLKELTNEPQFVKDNIETSIQLNEYRLKHNIPPIQDDSLWGFVEGCSKALVSLIALFAIVMGGGIVANEFSNGTIKLLLIRPSKRWKILLSKYISVLGYALFMLVILLITSILLGGILFGFGGIDIPYLTHSNGQIQEVNMLMHVLATCGLECINLVMMVTLAFMISSVFRNGAMAIGIGVFLLTVGNMITMMLARFDWAKYILFANTNLNQYIDGQPLIEGMTMQFSIIVLIVYFVIFQAIAYFGFIKRDITA